MLGLTDWDNDPDGEIDDDADGDREAEADGLVLGDRLESLSKAK